MHPLMTLSKTLSILLLTSSLAFAGCKKKEEPPGAAAAVPTAGSEPTAAPKAAAPAPAAPAAAPAATASAAPSGPITSDDDYLAKATWGMDQVITIFKDAGGNCDKLADSITRFATENGAYIKATRDYEKAHPEAQGKFNAASDQKTKAFQEAAMPAMASCKDSKKLADAMNKLSNEQ
jgi:hypothetical protein